MTREKTRKNGFIHYCINCGTQLSPKQANFTCSNCGSTTFKLKKMKKEVKIQVFSLGEWRNLKRKPNAFVRSVLSKHILLYGAEI